VPIFRASLWQFFLKTSNIICFDKKLKKKSSDKSFKFNNTPDCSKTDMNMSLLQAFSQLVPCLAQLVPWDDQLVPLLAKYNKKKKEDDHTEPERALPDIEEGLNHVFPLKEERPRWDLFATTLYLIMDGNLLKWFVMLLLLMVMKAICAYYETMSFTSFITTENNPTSYLWQMLMFQIGGQGINFADRFIRRKYFDPRLHEDAERYFWKLIRKSDPEWLSKMKNTYVPSIDDGVVAIKGIVNQSINIISPGINILVQLIVVIRLAKNHGILVILSAMIILTIGIKLTKYNFMKTKVQEKEKTGRRNDVNDLSRRFPIAVLNGNGKRSQENIVGIHRDIQEIGKEHAILMSGCWALLESTHNICVTFSIIYMCMFIKGKDLLAIIFATHRACENSWWMFNSLNHLFTTASKWGAIEKLLLEYEPMKWKRDTVDDQELDLNKIIPGMTIDSIDLLKAKTGIGKTSWMKAKVISLYRTFQQTDKPWLYLDQKMTLDSVGTIRHQTNQTGVKNLNTEILFKYAKRLGLGRIINEETIDKNWDEPSTGEIQRIMFLFGILPILHGKKIRVLFLDEITSGLDYGAWLIVMTIITELRHKHELAVVIIDHHECFNNHEEPCSMLTNTYNVKGIIYTLPVKTHESPQHEESIFCRFFQNQMKTYQLEDKKVVGKGVIAWLTECESEATEADIPPGAKIVCNTSDN